MPAWAAIPRTCDLVARRTPFRGCLHGAARQRRLEHQHRVAPSGLLLDDRARRPAADLLVGGPQHDDACAGAALPASSSARVASMAMRDPGLHVEHARTVESSVGLCERHAVELARPATRCRSGRGAESDARGRSAELRAQMVAAVALRQPRHASADRLEARRQLSAAAIDRRLVGPSRRLDARQRLDGLERARAR